MPNTSHTPSTPVTSQLSAPITVDSVLANEAQYTNEITQRLRLAGELSWQRFPLPYSHPTFTSCPSVATHTISSLPQYTHYLVMRDPCLHAMRLAVLIHNLTLIIPTPTADNLISIPGNAIHCPTNASRPSLRINPAPPGSKPYFGPIDTVIVSCLAFNPLIRRLYTFEPEKTAHTLERLYDGLDSGFRLDRQVPVICLAADQQEVSDWPESALGYVSAHFVITPTRCIRLGTGETVAWGNEGEGAPIG